MAFERTRVGGRGRNVERRRDVEVHVRVAVIHEYFWDHAEALKAVGLEE